MEKPRYYLCHAGSADFKDEANGEAILGAVYVFEGEWIRSPADVADRDRNPIMVLRPLWRDAGTEIHGDLGCFTLIDLDLDAI